MKSDKKILALIFIVSIVGLFTGAVTIFDIQRQSIIFSMMEWMNYISPTINLYLIDARVLSTYNHTNGLIINYFNLAFYAILFIGGILYVISKGKETRIIRFSFAVLLLSKVLIFLFIIPNNLMHLEKIKDFPYKWIQTFYFFLNHGVWIYLSYYVLTALTKERVLEMWGDDTKTISPIGLVDTPRAQRLTHVVLDSILCLLISAFYIFNMFDKSVLAGIQSLAGERVAVYVLFFICSLIYYIFFEVLFGSTPAKFLTESRVVTLDGKKISLKQGTLRTLYRHVPLASLSFLFGRDGAHDYWSNTVVVKEKRIGCKTKTYLLFFPAILVIGIGSFWAYEKYQQKKADDTNRKQYSFEIKNLQNELSHLDSTVVLQLSNVNDMPEDSTRLLKVESIKGDSIVFKSFKVVLGFGKTYEIESGYLLLPAALPTIKVHKSKLQNCYVSDYDTYKKGERKGERFFEEDQKYEISNIHRLFGPSIQYDGSVSTSYSNNELVEIRFLNAGSTGRILAIENLEGNIKWADTFPMQIDGLEKSFSQAHFSLIGENYKMDEWYMFAIVVEDLTGAKQKYVVELEGTEVFISRVIE